MSNDIDHRLRQALGDAAGQIAPDGTRPPGLELPSKSRPPRWPVIALAAAAAVSLIVAVPYAIGGSDSKPKPAKEPVTEAPSDPAPLGPPLKPTVAPFFVSTNIGGTDMVAEVTGIDGNRVQKLRGDHFWSVSASPDRHTFYLTWNDHNPSCSARIYKLTLGPDGKERKREVVPGTEENGVVLSNVVISPDGKRLAWAYDSARNEKGHCGARPRPTRSTPNPAPYPGSKHGLTVLDLANQQSRSWTVEQVLDNGNDNAVSWSMDSRYLVFPWPIDTTLSKADAEQAKKEFEEVSTPGATPRAFTIPPTPTASPTTVMEPKPHRMLDPTIAAGDLLSRSRAVPLDATSFPGYGRFEILKGAQLYPPELTAYAPRGGARVLATARSIDYESGMPSAVLLDVWLGSGKITVIDEDYEPMQGEPGW